MKKEINLLAEKRVNEEVKKREKLLQKLTIGFLAIFLVFNLLLFGVKFYFYKTTADFINDAQRLTQNIKTMSSVETSYRKFLSKLKYLTGILEKQGSLEKSFSFTGNILSSKESLLKLSFVKDSRVTVELALPDSSSVEQELNKFKEAQAKGQISDLKIVSLNKVYDKEKNTSSYNFKISFKLDI